MDYFDRLPRLLRDEFTNGRWLPVVGAGLSANAMTRTGQAPPMWSELGDAVREYLPAGYGADGPIDALSTYAQLHGRPALVDRVHDALLIDEVMPGHAHSAFARIPFDVVLTTNVDFLLEAAWTSIGWPFDPVVGEQRLTARRRVHSTQLIKFHGDMHHPNELVLTEEDYDAFLNRFPLLATYVASLLITRVPVLFGYSLDDPDFRSILQLLSNRLGPNRPAPWVLLAKATPAQIARYERRGVRVVVLDRNPRVSHADVFASLFERLAQELPNIAGAKAESAEDRVLSELRLKGNEEDGGLIVFLGANDYLAQDRAALFPQLRAQGMTPVTPEEIYSAPGLALASLAQLVRRAAVVVVDVRGPGRTDNEMSVALSQHPGVPVIVIDVERGGSLPPGLHTARVLRVTSEGTWADDFRSRVVGAISDLASPKKQTRTARIRNRLESGDVIFAFLESVIVVESLLRTDLDQDHSPRSTSFGRLVRLHPNVSESDEWRLREIYEVRSKLLHQGTYPTEEDASVMTRYLLDLIRRLE